MMFAKALKKISRGLLFSALAVLASASPTVTLSSPARNVLAPGVSVNLGVSATGSGALTYQWLHKGKAVVGATGSSLSIANATYADSGWYLIDVTDSTGTSRSAPMFVTVAPTVTQIRALGIFYDGHNSVPIAMPVGLNDAIAIAAAENHLLAIKRDGTVIGVGRNDGGEFTFPADLTNVVAVAAGAYHSVVLKADGTVAAFGNNVYGQLAIPAGLSDVVAVAAGITHSLALRKDGTMVAWGSNTSGEANVPTGLTDAVDLAGGDYFSLALRQMGTVTGWGTNWTGQTTAPAGISNFVQIAAAQVHAVGLKADGTVVAWGWSGGGTISVPAGLTNVVSIAARGRHSLALRSDGTIATWGQFYANEGSLPTGLTDVFAIAAGEGFSAALRDATKDTAPVVSVQPVSQNLAEMDTATFTVIASGPAPLSYQWRKAGVNLPGKTAANLQIRYITQGDAGRYDVVVTNDHGSTTSSPATLTVRPIPVVTGLSATRHVLIPGQSLELNVIATGTGSLSYQWTHNGRAIADATSSSLSLAGVTYQDNGYYLVSITDSNGTRRSAPMFVTVAPPITLLQGWGEGSLGQLDIPADLTDLISVKGGGLFAGGLRRDGTVLVWGDRYYEDFPRTTPAGLSEVVAISTGDAHILALRADGTVVAWGHNYSGETIVPAGLTDVVAVAAGSNHSLALKSDGTVVAWGLNLSDPAETHVGLSNVVAIEGRDGRSLAIKSDGTVVEWWRYNGPFDQQVAPSGLSGVTMVAAGLRHVLALKNDNSVVAWGDNDEGQKNLPSIPGPILSIAAGNGHSLALGGDRHVVAWGSNYYGQATAPADWPDVIGIAAGSTFSLALRDASGDPVPQILAQPMDLTVVENQAASLAVGTASSYGPLRYQWRKNGANIPGANASTLTLAAVQGADAGDYDVVVTNHIGSTTSAPAHLAVNPLPVVATLSPARQVLRPGQELHLGVTATGAGSLSYQWVRNGQIVAGATGTDFVVPHSTYADAGWYVVDITDNVGTRRSKPIFVTITPTATKVSAWGYDMFGQTEVPVGLNDAIGLAAGLGQSLAVRANGRVTAWGQNSVYANSSFGGVTDGVAVASGYYHSLILKSDGTVLVWDYYSSPTSLPPAGLTDVVAIAAGSYHSLALKTDGTVVAWGDSNYGKTSVPAGLTDVVAIAAGVDHSLALRRNGTVAAWGASGFGECNVPAGLENVVSIAAGGYQSFALKNDGTVVAWGNNNSGQLNFPPGLSGVRAISSGLNHVLAVRSDGLVTGWGDVFFGQLSMPVGLKYPLSLSAGGYFSLALCNAVEHDVNFGATTLPLETIAGTMVNLAFVVTNAGGLPWDDHHTLFLRDSDGNQVAAASLSGVQPGGTITVSFSFTAPESLGNRTYTVQAFEETAGWFGDPQSFTIMVNPKGLVAISAGSSHGLGLQCNGELYGFGGNASGQLGSGDTAQQGNPRSNGQALAFAAGWDHSLFVKTDGTLWTMGGNSNGQLGDGTTTGRLSPVQVPGATNVALVAGGLAHSLFIKSDGTLWGMGGGAGGRLGDGTGLDRPSPVQIATGVIGATAGVNYTGFIKQDGSLWTMGNNGNGQLGDGTTAGKLSPVHVADNVATVSAHGYHLLILKQDGTLWSTGMNLYGQLGEGTTTNHSTPVQIATGVAAFSSGTYHSLYVKTDGTLWAMGYNASGQLGDGTTTNRSTPVQVASGVAAVAGGNDFSLFIKTDGSLWGMGSNASGQLLSGGSASYATPVQLLGGPLTAPDAPMGLSATDGTRATSVGLTWAPVPGATRYEVWRSTSNEANGSTRLSAAVTFPTYEDTTPVPGTAYYYWVKAVSLAGASAFSTADPGHAGTLVAVPQITTQPASQTVNVGDNVTFTVVANGTTPFTYQWRKDTVNLVDGGNISGATTATLTITNAQASDAGSYDVVVTNSAGAVTSNAATLAVPPALTAQTQWQKVFAGNNATFSVTANGATGYQWERSTDGGANWAALSDGGSFAGATTATLTVSEVDAGMSGWRFRAVVTGAGGAVTTTPATLTTLASTPGILWGGVAGPVRLLPVLTPKVVGGGVASVAAGAAHTMFLKTDGTLWAAGNNQYGQFGTGTTSSNPQSTPVQVASGVVSVSAGTEYTVFLKTDGTLLGMGSNTPGILSGFPMTVATNVASAAAGSAHAMLVKTDGTLWAMGANIWGQLGDGTTTDRYTPVQVATDVASVAAGGSHTVFVKTDGSLWAMGSNHYGELGDSTTTNRSTPVQIATGVVSVAAGSDHTVFVKTDGSLWAMGSNYYGELGDGTTTDRSTPVQIATGVASIAAGGLCTVFVKTDGSLWGMGANFYGALGDGTTADRSTPVQIATDVASVAASGAHTVFVKTDGTLWTHGSNEWGQLGDRQATPHAPPIATDVLTAGADLAVNNLFVKSDGTLWQHVQGQVSQVAGVSGVVQAIIGSFNSHRLYLKGDGTLWLLAQDGTSSQVASGVVSAGSGLNYTAYLLGDGSLWGQGGDGTWIQFGDGTAPVQIADHAVSLSTAAFHLLFTKDDQTLWGMGTAWSGFAPGAGWTQYVSVPGQLETGVVSAAAGLNQNLSLKTDGTLWTRGSGWADTAGPAAQVDSDVLSAAVGLNSSLYLKADGILRLRAGVQGALGAITPLAENVGSLFGSASDATGWYMYLQAPGSGTAPAITTQPQTTALSTGTTMTLQVTATGTAPMAYQWFKDGVAVPWAQAAQYPIPYATATDAGSYTVTITNSAGAITSDVATLALAPSITTHPQTQSAEVGASVAFTVVATSTPAPTYQWRKDSVDIGGATGSSLTLSNLQLSDAGSYTVVVTNAGGSATSNPAVLTVGASFNSWQQSKFTAGERADANVSGPNAVYGQDGLPNLVKYALGLEPKQNATTGLPAVSTTATDWVYTYTRPSDRTDITYEVEVSSNLTTWSAVGVTHELVSSSGGIETWHARYPLASAPNIYFRLVATIIAP